ncbi:hypothetical protein B0T25DRAFT_530583 [Lasiosphaeria hispida]|uniref:Cell wall protein n=1 Tax=Lasiosphaeria hispida TaxID=260671 RepID=A0AAJ0HXN4_9PEZI|nr:hypothetical protein B0T25DRAFT_530583 [Lasiosphaeria hispida]
MKLRLWQLPASLLTLAALATAFPDIKSNTTRARAGASLSKKPILATADEGVLKFAADLLRYVNTIDTLMSEVERTVDEGLPLELLDETLEAVKRVESLTGPKFPSVSELVAELRSDVADIKSLMDKTRRVLRRDRPERESKFDICVDNVVSVTQGPERGVTEKEFKVLVGFR